VPHQAETQSHALLSASAACTHRKRLILLCCEELRPVACALEDALRSRGWDVSVELGADAKPWVQKVPVVQPSVRVLCVPGTVDRALAQQLRAAYRPEPEADLHILGVDDSPGLVYEIERLAGVRTPARRSLNAPPRLAHAMLVETQARSARSWRVGAASALTAFAITFGGMSLVEHSARAPELSPTSLAGGITRVTTPRPADLDSDTPRTHEPVLAAVAPMDLERLDEPPPEEDEEIILLDEVDEPTSAQPRALDTPTGRVDVLASPLAAPASALAITEAITPPGADTITITAPLPTLPPGFLPVAGLPLSEAAATTRQLPRGFLPVAGMSVAPPVTTVDPFATADVTVTNGITTVDPFGPSLDAAAP
jgi:hypothetical protein